MPWPASARGDSNSMHRSGQWSLERKRNAVNTIILGLGIDGRCNSLCLMFCHMAHTDMLLGPHYRTITRDIG